jgi:hypothetical protein
VPITNDAKKWEFSGLTWEKAVKRDLKEWNISKELVLDRSVWKMTIHILEYDLGVRI